MSHFDGREAAVRQAVIQMSLSAALTRRGLPLIRAISRGRIRPPLKSTRPVDGATPDALVLGREGVP